MLTDEQLQQLRNAALVIFATAVWILCLAILQGCNAYGAMYQAQPTQGATSTAAPDVIQPSPTNTNKPTQAPAICEVTTGLQLGRVNLRTQPGTSAGIIRVLAEGEILTVIERGAWLEVIDHASNHGFINSKYCTIGE